MSENLLNDLSPVPAIVPAYEADEHLLVLLRALSGEKRLSPIIVVNDGSGPASMPVFADVHAIKGVVLLKHPRNLGKGAALKTAFRYCLAHFPDCIGVVTADCDGQHTPEDILATGKALETHPDCLVLGTRNFAASDIPARSWLGNRISRMAFRLTGVRVSDTQTGLRGIPRGLLPSLLEIPYDRYEFETAMLIQVARRGVSVWEQPIRTVYLDRNKGSHFAPLRDSFRIYRVLLSNTAAQMQRFIFTALASAALDLFLFYLLFTWLLPSLGLPRLIGASVLARIVSATFNYLLNRRYVFRHRGHWDARSFAHYTGLCLLLAGASYACLRGLLPLLPSIPATLLKALVDLLLFLVSFAVQKCLVFRPQPSLPLPRQ